MSENAKRAYISIISALGVIILLVGLFTDAYSFWVGLIVAIACWIASGILAKYWGVKGKKD